MVPPVEVFTTLIGNAIQIAIVTFVLQISFAKMFAKKHRYQINPTQVFLIFRILILLIFNSKFKIRLGIYSIWISRIGYFFFSRISRLCRLIQMRNKWSNRCQITSIHLLFIICLVMKMSYICIKLKVYFTDISRCIFCSIHVVGIFAWDSSNCKRFNLY